MFFFNCHGRWSCSGGKACAREEEEVEEKEEGTKEGEHGDLAEEGKNEEKLCFKRKIDILIKIYC